MRIHFGNCTFVRDKIKRDSSDDFVKVLLNFFLNKFLSSLKISEKYGKATALKIFHKTSVKFELKVFHAI